MSDLEEGLSSFSSVEEELEYWKRKSLEYCERSRTLIMCGVFTLGIIKFIVLGTVGNIC